MKMHECERDIQDKCKHTGSSNWASIHEETKDTKKQQEEFPIERNESDQ